jgi:hypothetical protein
MGCKLTNEHGGEIKKHTCNHDKCDKWSVSGGFCGDHGGKRTCKHDKCDKWSVSGGFCGEHGGETKKRTCKHDKCDSGQYLVDFVVSTVAARGNDAARVKGRRVMMIPR